MGSTPVTCKCEDQIKLVLLHRFLNIIEVSTLSFLIICKKCSYWKGFIFSGNFRRRGIKPHIKCWEKILKWAFPNLNSCLSMWIESHENSSLQATAAPPTSSLRNASLSVLGPVPCLWALFGCRDLPNLTPPFSSFTGRSCSFR